jgi:short-subunit dehydrogenase
LLSSRALRRASASSSPAAAHATGTTLSSSPTSPRFHAAQTKLSALGAAVESFEADLATPEGCEQIYAALKGRPVAALLANAGVGLGTGFLDQEFEAWSRVVDTKVMGTLYLIQKIGRDMRARREGKILITGSIAGFMPGTYQAVYNGSKALSRQFLVRSAS